MVREKGAVPADTLVPMSPSIREQLRERLVEEMEERGLSAFQIAKEMDIGNGQIYDFINGKPSVSIERIEAIFQHLGYDVIADVIPK
jgi:transcriptional regulator with XRE-family HTH domain